MLDNFELYVACRRIADLVHSYQAADRGRIWMEDLRGQTPNPYYKQTISGLFLEEYYGLPNRLWTPWGEWHFGGSGSGDWSPVNAVILPRLRATVHLPGRQANIGYIGPVYAVHCVGELVLPDPIERPSKQYVPYKDANAAWGRLTARYQQAQV